jgi:putative endonuclease
VNLPEAPPGQFSWLHPDFRGFALHDGLGTALAAFRGVDGTGDGRRALGARGEELAARYLVRRGFRVLEANARCRFGEIDLIALHAGTVVFVEVKGKTGKALGPPEEMVTAWKRRRLTRLARWYLQRRGWLDRPARFDVVAVAWEPGGAVVRHIPDAFPASDAW